MFPAIATTTPTITPFTIDGWLQFGALGLLAGVLAALFVATWRFVPRLMKLWSQHIAANTEMAHAHSEIAHGIEKINTAFHDKVEDSNRRHSEVMSAFERQTQAIDRLTDRITAAMLPSGD